MSTPYRAAAPATRPQPVPYDPELLAGLEHFRALVEPTPLRADNIHEHRENFLTVIPDIQTQAAGRAVRWEHRTVPGPTGEPDVEITIIWPEAASETGNSPGVDPPRPAPPRPAVLGIHGGGYVLGTRFFATTELIDLAERYGTVGVAVEYRLAPEHPAPAAAEDCFAVLCWMVSQAPALGIDPSRIVVSGASAGAGLTAAVALMARDRGGPKLAGQLVNAPMIDDRNDSVSSWQYDGLGVWDRHNNDTGWDAMLGEDRGTDRVHPYQAPARADDLSGLAPAYLEVGAAEVFRDETIAYASRIWAAGGEAELHVWSGGYHGFSGSSPSAQLAQAANEARASWWRRILA